jgi:hypothetical protein
MSESRNRCKLVSVLSFCIGHFRFTRKQLLVLHPSVSDQVDQQHNQNGEQRGALLRSVVAGRFQMQGTLVTSETTRCEATPVGLRRWSSRFLGSDTPKTPAPAHFCECYVCCWPKADMAERDPDVRFRGWSGHPVKLAAMSAFDP